MASCIGRPVPRHELGPPVGPRVDDGHGYLHFGGPDPRKPAVSYLTMLAAGNTAGPFLGSYVSGNRQECSVLSPVLTDRSGPSRVL